MKSGCKIYTQKCYVTLGPLCYISNMGCVAHNLCNVPSENNSACESALSNFANKSSMFEDFFLKQHRSLFQSWAKHCYDRQPRCLIIINIQCMGFNTYCGTCKQNWC